MRGRGYKKGQRFGGKLVPKRLGLAPLLFGPLHFMYSIEDDECYIEFDEGALYGKQTLNHEQATAAIYWLLKARDVLGSGGSPRTRTWA